MAAKITDIKSHKILDAQGKWTIEARVFLDNGIQSRASVPSGGHSVGKYEAKLVPTEVGVESINTIIAEALRGKDVQEQTAIDSLLLNLDGTPDKSKLGANTLLAVSLSVFKASCRSFRLECYDYLNRVYSFEPISLEKFPTPLLNLINGGEHASNKLEFQSFMIAPGTFMEYSKSLEMGVEVYHKLKEDLKFKNLNTDVGDEGGFAPSGIDIDQACHFIVDAIRGNNIKPGADMFLAIDAAASTFFDGTSYKTGGVVGSLSGNELKDLYVNLARSFPILYLEDPFTEDAWEDWSELVKILGDSVEIVGDDLTVTNPLRLDEAIQKKAITGIIIKPDQIGTLTETIQVIKKAQANDITVIISHRSGETSEDVFMSDLAVGVGARYIKAGAPARGERTVKYNRLLEIEHDLKLRRDRASLGDTKP